MQNMALSISLPSHTCPKNITSTGNCPANIIAEVNDSMLLSGFGITESGIEFTEEGPNL